eukprot:4660808-Amphidinium_carterae.1
MEHANPSPSLPQIEQLRGVTETPEERESGLHQAQKEIVRLFWVANRTRPDILAIVGILASELHTSPCRVTSLCQGIWRYLHRPHALETLRPGRNTGDAENTAFVAADTDARFASNGDSRSRSAFVLYLGSLDNQRGL